LGKLVKETSYLLEGQDRSVKIRKWSGRKFFMILGELFGVVDETINQVSVIENSSLEMFLARLVVNLGRSSDKVYLVVRESLVEPTTNEDLDEWDMEDVLGVLDKAFEVNLTESSQKKIRLVFGHLGRLFGGKNGMETGFKTSGVSASASKT
jgi:hypothetical protein